MRKLRVEVIYALPDVQRVVALELAEGATAAEAVAASGLVRAAAQAYALGSFGQRIRPDRRVCDGDRIEILRPLAADPKEARRARARRRR